MTTASASRLGPFDQHSRSADGRRNSEADVRVRAGSTAVAVADVRQRRHAGNDGVAKSKLKSNRFCDYM